MKNWSRGITLMTQQTKRWPPEMIKENDRLEQARVFSDFSSRDGGRSREVVCTINEFHKDYEQNALLIENAPELLESLKACIDIVNSEGLSLENRKKLAIAVDLVNKL
jgi:hypothetical protein